MDLKQLGPGYPDPYWAELRATMKSLATLDVSMLSHRYYRYRRWHGKAPRFTRCNSPVNEGFAERVD